MICFVIIIFRSGIERRRQRCVEHVDGRADARQAERAHWTASQRRRHLRFAVGARARRLGQRSRRVSAKPRLTFEKFVKSCFNFFL